MNIVISNNSSVPLYQQIKNQIKEAILLEEVKAGETLPSIRNLANDLSVSILTIRRVYDDLEKEGFVVSRPGIGTLVTQGNLELIKETKRRKVEEGMLKLIKEAKLLGMSKQEFNEVIDILSDEEDFQ